MLIVLIIVIAAVTVVVVSWRTPSSNTGTPTPTPTATATPIVTDPFAVTPTVTTTPTVTITPTPTITVTATPTPTVTVETGTFDEIRNTAWVFGVTEQTVGSSVYFIDTTNPKIVRKGSSTSDAGAQAVFTSDNAGNVGSFYVNGSYLYVVTKRDATTNYSKFKRVALSSGSVAKLYEFFSSKYEATQFAINKNNDAKAGFYVGLEGLNDNAEPAGMYIKGYIQQWIKPFVGTGKTASISKLSPTTDNSQLAGLFLVGSTSSQAYVDVD